MVKLPYDYRGFCVTRIGKLWVAHRSRDAYFTGACGSQEEVEAKIREIAPSDKEQIRKFLAQKGKTI